MSSAPKKYIHDRPAVPIGISTNAGSGDPIVKEYLSQLMSHLVSNQYGDAIANEMENGLKMLPCIKNVTRDTNNPNRAIIDYKNGETSTMRLAPLSRKPAITPDTVVDHVSQACRRYVKRLEKGDLYSFSNGGSRIHTFGAGTAKEVMPDVVKVLCSSLDDEAKAKQLAGMLGMADVPKEESSAFVQNLDPSKQGAAGYAPQVARPQSADVGIKRNIMNTKYYTALIATALISLSSYGADKLSVIFPDTTNLVFTVPINDKVGERPYDAYLEYPSEYEDGRPTKFGRTGLGFYIHVEVIEETDNGVHCKLKVDHHTLSDWNQY
jgi:hypothetical protein